MCGIAGIVSWDEDFRITREMLLKMSAAIAHRGPDGEGIFLSRENEPIDIDHPQVGFAFRRLAILDPEPRSMQPFTIDHLTMVFNGEIFNFRELKAELSTLKPDYQWRTSGDVEVLVMSYQVWGEKCVEHLFGQFAFAIWDEENKSLFLARDRMGQLPLFIAQPKVTLPIGVLAFASELSAFSDLTWCTAVPHATSFVQYLRYGCSPAFNTIYSYRQNQMGPGGWNVWKRSGSFRGMPYFNPNEPCRASGNNLKTLVERAVQRQLVSDVPLGVYLSGGIDSSVIALCARKLGPVKSFTIRFDDPRYDESKYARQVAQHIGADHHEFLVTPDVIEDLPKLAQVFGEPFADSSTIPTMYLARETRKHVKVALSGDGGDELFGGYDRYRAMKIAHKMRSMRFVATIARSWTGGHPKSKLTRAARLLSSLDLSDAQRYDRFMRIFDDAMISELLREDPKTTPKIEEIYARELARTGDVVAAALATDRITYLPDDLLTKVDRASMLHGLEVRNPFMDHELVQFAAGLTSDQLLKGGPKRMLREAFADDLPAFVFKRKKMGFAVPIGEWFRGPLRAFLRDHLFASDSFAKQHFHMSVVERMIDEHDQSRVDHSQRLYALLMLELWWTQKNG